MSQTILPHDLVAEIRSLRARLARLENLDLVTQANDFEDRISLIEDFRALPLITDWASMPTGSDRSFGRTVCFVPNLTDYDTLSSFQCYWWLMWDGTYWQCVGGTSATQTYHDSGSATVGTSYQSLQFDLELVVPADGVYLITYSGRIYANTGAAYSLAASLLKDSDSSYKLGVDIWTVYPEGGTSQWQVQHPSTTNFATLVGDDLYAVQYKSSGSVGMYAYDETLSVMPRRLDP